MKEYNANVEDDSEDSLSDEHTDDYDVGYGKPPKRTQFKKGQSGNPKRGKNKPKPFVDHLTLALERKIQAVVNGKTTETTRMKLAAEITANKAAKGEKWVIEMLNKVFGSNPRDLQMQNENRQLRKRLQRANDEIERLKNEPKGGLLVIPPAAVNELDLILRGESPAVVKEYMQENPDALDEMLALLEKRRKGEPIE